MKLTEAEWRVMDVLWEQKESSLGEIVEALRSKKNWNRNTVLTYLTRMEKKGLVTIKREQEPHRYAPLISRYTCLKAERELLIKKVERGSVGDLIAAFLKENKITSEEKKRLSQLLDDMEV